MDKHGKTIESWRGLEEYGFELLTGEACGISQRLLIDLTQQGLDYLREFLSMKIEPGNNWNHGRGAIASVMLPDSMWRELAIYILAQTYERVVSVAYSGQGYRSSFVRGMSADTWEECQESYQLRYPNSYRVYWSSGTARGGMRNRHEMSGRVE